MDDKFAQDVIKELNKFRSNPKSLQHQCEIIRTGFSRFRAEDPFLKEIDAFVKDLDSLNKLPNLKYNEVLSNAAKKELPNFRGKEDYQKYRRTVKGIVPDFYLVANPAMVADDGAEEPINVLTKILLDRSDKAKEGRKILCDPKFTQVGIAHEVFTEDNMVILIFATQAIEDPKLRAPVKKTKQDFILNIQYHETKDLKNQKYEVVVNHRIKGDIFGGGKFIKSSSQKEISSKGVSRPNDNQPKLRGNKSELRTASASNRTGNRDKNPTSATAKNEKIQQTLMKRRNDGTSSKTETRTETKTTTSGIRGQGRETNSTTTKTTTRTTSEKPGSEVTRRTQQTTTTTTTTKTVTKVEEKGGDDAGNSVRQKYSKKKRF